MYTQVLHNSSKFASCFKSIRLYQQFQHHSFFTVPTEFYYVAYKRNREYCVEVTVMLIDSEIQREYAQRERLQSFECSLNSKSFWLKFKSSMNIRSDPEKTERETRMVLTRRCSKQEKKERKRKSTKVLLTSIRLGYSSR